VTEFAIIRCVTVNSNQIESAEPFIPCILTVNDTFSSDIKWLIILNSLLGLRFIISRLSSVSYAYGLLEVF